MKLKASAAVIGVLWATSAAATPLTPDTAQGWADAARRDVDEAYTQFAANHPGMYDKANPQFPAVLNQARANGLALVPRVKDAAGYQAVMDRFSVTLGDGHAQVVPTLPEGSVGPVEWPGFVAAWRNDRLLVYAAEAGGPPAGSTVLSCDRKPAHDLMVSNVFAFEGRVKEDGQWWSRGRELFVDEGNPFIARPAICDFTFDGKVTSLALTWRATDDSYMKWRTDSYNGEVLLVGLTEPEPGLLWLSMPTFTPDEAARDAYAAMFKEITNNRERFIKARAVVIDLRNNQGGSSEWSYQAAEGLWGKARFDRRVKALFAHTHVRWRASQGNADFVLSLVKRMRDEKRDLTADKFQPIATGLKAAADHGKIWFDEASDRDAPKPADAALQPKANPPPLTVPVYVIVGGQCASACDDALDYFTRFGNTRLIGAPSSADSNYLEIRVQPLPSGLAATIIPNKVYIGRARAAGAFYRPDIINSSLSWSMQSFIDLIDSDQKNKHPNRNAHTQIRPGT